jgi:hypothetical protein
MMDYTITQARSGGVLPPTLMGHGRGHRGQDHGPFNTTHHQLMEIHAIGAAQLAECAHRPRFYSTPSLVQM